MLGICTIDFVPAIGTIAPATPSDPSSCMSSSRSPLFLGVIDGSNEEMTRLHQQYTTLVHSNRK